MIFVELTTKETKLINEIKEETQISSEEIAEIKERLSYLEGMICPIVSKNFACIYLLQDGNDIGTEVYKIGKTNRGTTGNQRKFDRFLGYTKDTEIILTCKVSSEEIDNIEKELIKKFEREFKLHKGREWFEGDIKNMKKIIYEYMCENNL